jgi:membrane-bound ClpP family serine protease
MSNQELLVQQFVAAVIRLAACGPTDGTARPVPSFGDVEAAVREHFKMQDVNLEALVEAVRKAAAVRRPEVVDRALSNLRAAHAQELLAGQQTAFLIGLEVGRSTTRRPR